MAHSRTSTLSFINKIFYKDSTIVVLVYDITRKGSFEVIKNYLCHEIKQYNENSSEFKLVFLFIFLIGIVRNKYDKYEEEEVNEDDAKKFDYEIKGILDWLGFFYSLGNFYLETLSRFDWKNQLKNKILK